MMQTRPSRRGYTLVEIMVVVAILTSLMAVLAINVHDLWQQHKVKETELRMGLLDTALQGYAATHRGRYPSTDEGLEAASAYLRSDGDDAFEDAWTRPMVYVAPDEGALYCITSLGRDGREGGEGLDADIVLRVR